MLIIRELNILYIICLILFLKGFVKMQGSYNKLVESNKDFIQMMNELTTSHETQKKEENARKISEMSSKNISIFRRTSEATIASTIVVRQSLSFVNSLCFFIVFVR